MIGFMPGFPFMGDLPSALDMPRRREPRPACAGGVGGDHRQPDGDLSVAEPGRLAADRALPGAAVRCCCCHAVAAGTGRHGALRGHHGTAPGRARSGDHSAANWGHTRGWQRRRETAWPPDLPTSEQPLHDCHGRSCLPRRDVHAPGPGPPRLAPPRRTGLRCAGPGAAAHRQRAGGQRRRRRSDRVLRGRANAEGARRAGAAWLRRRLFAHPRARQWRAHPTRQLAQRHAVARRHAARGFAAQQPLRRGGGARAGGPAGARQRLDLHAGTTRRVRRPGAGGRRQAQRERHAAQSGHGADRADTAAAAAGARAWRHACRARPASRPLRRGSTRELLRQRIPGVDRSRPHGRAACRALRCFTTSGAARSCRTPQCPARSRCRATACRSCCWPMARRPAATEDRHRDFRRPSRAWRWPPSAPRCASSR